MATLRQAARWYAKQGLPVFPLRPRGKEPATAHGFKDASTDAATVNNWWKENPEYNIGMATGVKVDVIDIDGPQGRESIKPYIESLPIVGRATTAREDGGEHLFIPATGWGNNNREYKRKYPGLDYRGAGGYVVMAPSVGATGRKYKWVSNPDFNSVPQTDLNHPFFSPFKSREESAEETVSLLGVDITGYAIDHEAQQELAACAWQMFTEPEGNRNHTFNALCFKVGRLIGAGRLDEDESVDTMRRAATEAGLQAHEISATLKSGITAGKKDPKTREVTPHVEEQGPTAGRVDFHEEWEKAEDDIPWIIWPIVAERRLTALYSVPKVGKSLFALDAVIKVSRGEPFLDHEPVNGPVTVLYLDKENDVRGDIITRAKAMEYGPDAFDNIAYYSFHDLPSMDTEAGGQKVLALAQEHGAGLVVVDTVSRHIEGEENSNDTWLQWYRCTGARLKQHGIACIRIDHAGKDEAKGQRGGSAKSGDIDLIWRMSLQREDVVRLKLDSQRMQVPKDARDLTVERVSDPLSHQITEDVDLVAGEIAPRIREAEAAGLSPRSSIAQVRKEMKMGYPAAKRFLSDWQEHTTIMVDRED